MTATARTESATDLGPVIRLRPSGEEKLLRDTVAGVARSFGHSYFMDKVNTGQPPSELWDALGRQGYLGACLPAEYGGGGQGRRIPTSGRSRPPKKQIEVIE